MPLEAGERKKAKFRRISRARIYDGRPFKVSVFAAAVMAMAYLVIYNLVFVVPLVVIVVLLYSGAATFRLKRWRQENRKWMNLASGCLMLALGGFLIAYYGLRWYL